MIKVFEYMAYGLPVVLYDLTEGRRLAGDAALYAKGNDAGHFADQIATLLDAASLRGHLRAVGKKRIQERLNWEVEKLKLQKTYEVAFRREMDLQREGSPEDESLRTETEQTSGLFS